MDLDPSVVWDFAGTLVGTLRERPRQLPATVSRVDPDGTVWLSMPGADGLVPASTTADVRADDAVTVEWWGNAYHVTGNGTSPSVGTRAAAALRRATAAAAKVAGEAKGIADAVGQHFWSDDNGVHVSNEDGNATGERNILMNSLGILLRQGSAWLASFSDSAVAFYDGLGNEAANIVAQFGADGARIGRIGMNRIELSEDGLVQFTDAGVVGIMAGLSATNHTVDVTHYLGLNKVYLGDVYWYDTLDGERKSSINVEYPFSSDSPNNIDKFILHMYLWRWPGGGSYDVVVPFGSDFSTIINWTDFRIDWDATGKELTITKESKEPNEFDYEVLDVEYTGYVTTASKRSPVLLFGEHSGMRSPGLYAVALGQNSTSDGDNASTLGIGTNAGYDAQTAIGKYNDNSSSNAFEIGNGTADDARSNAATIGWDGNYLGQAMAGIIQMFAGATPPSGWLICDGSAVSRTTYATLFAAIGTTWGTGDGSTTFNLPDLRGRAPIGAGTGSGLTSAPRTCRHTRTPSAARPTSPSLTAATRIRLRRATTTTH